MKPSDIEQNNFYLVNNKHILFEISLKNYSNMFYALDQMQGHNFQITVTLPNDTAGKIFELIPQNTEDGIFILDAYNLELYKIIEIQSKMGDYKELYGNNYGQGPKDILYTPNCVTTIVAMQMNKKDIFSYVDKCDVLILGL
jgi:hypothetical protein